MILILFGTIFSKNRGVNALTRATIDLIREVTPNEKIVLVGSGKEEEDEFEGIKFYPKMGLKKLPYYYVLSLLEGRLVAKKLFPNINSEIKVLDLSEGDSFTDIYGNLRFWNQLLSKLFYRNISTKYILLPQTIGPFENTIYRKLATNVMKKFDIIFARDLESKSFVERFTGKECDFCYDMAFCLSPKEIQRFDIGKIKGKIGINVSGLLWMGGYKKNNQFNLLVDYRELMVDISNYYMDLGHELVFIPHTYGGGISEDDLVASRELKHLLNERGKNIEIIEKEYSEQELKWIISNLEFFIGARMHSCIAAISMGVPSIGIAYSKKFKGVFESVGISDCVLDPRNLEKQEIIENINTLFKRRTKLKSSIEKVLPSVRHTLKEKTKKIIRE